MTLDSDAQKEQLLKTYQKELASLTAEDRRKDNPVAALQFKTNKLQSLIDEAREAKRDYTVFNEYYYYPVYSSFQETIQLLSECGIEVGEKLKPERIEKIMLQYVGNTPASLKNNRGIVLTKPEIVPGTMAEQLWQDKDGEEQRRRSQFNLTITEPQQIEEIMDAAVFNEISNDFNEQYHGIEILAYLPKEEDSKNIQEENDDFSEITWEETTTVSVEEGLIDSDAVDLEERYDVCFLNFDYDKIPEFVKDEFGLTKELMAYNLQKGY